MHERNKESVRVRTETCDSGGEQDEGESDEYGAGCACEPVTGTFDAFEAAKDLFGADHLVLSYP